MYKEASSCTFCGAPIFSYWKSLSNDEQPSAFFTCRCREINGLAPSSAEVPDQPATLDEHDAEYQPRKAQPASAFHATALEDG
jgi:hypothetical protein